MKMGEFTDTPKILNKKRNRIISKDNSLIKSTSTHLQTPLFTTTSQQKSNMQETRLEKDDNIVKNLDKIY
jgi:hypothetical protein